MKVFYAVVIDLKWFVGLLGFIWIGAQATTLIGPSEGLTQGDPNLAEQLLDLALRNEYQGTYTAEMEVLLTSYESGFERLSGIIKVDAEAGETQLDLQGDGRGIRYRSTGHGVEQWITDQTTQRVRRIANRQWKKSAVGTVLSYEDLMRLPSRILRLGESVKRFEQTDSSYTLTLSLSQEAKTFYSKLDAVLMKSPLRLNSITLYDNHGKRCKQVDVLGYQVVEGHWILNQYRVTNCDSSAQTYVTLNHPKWPERSALAIQDHAFVKGRKPAMRIEVPQPSWVPTSRPFSPHAMPGLDEKTKATLLKGPSLKQAGQGLNPVSPRVSDHGVRMQPEEAVDPASEGDSAEATSTGEEGGLEASEDSDPDDL